MAFAFQRQVDPENEARMRGYYETLSEKVWATVRSAASQAAGVWRNNLYCRRVGMFGQDD